jgi:hypothetical protein
MDIYLVSLPRRERLGEGFLKVVFSLREKNPLAEREVYRATK